MYWVPLAPNIIKVYQGFYSSCINLIVMLSSMLVTLPEQSVSLVVFVPFNAGLNNVCSVEKDTKCFSVLLLNWYSFLRNRC